MTAELAVAALRNVVALRDVDETTPHSDCGSQVRSRKFIELPRDVGITGSTGWVGACGDSAAMDSFFALLQENVLDKKRWQTREKLQLEMVARIESPYRRRGR